MGLLEKVRKRFYEEVEGDDLFWVILRESSAIDTIFVSIAKYNQDSSEENSITLIIDCIKSLIVNKLKDVQVSDLSSSQLMLKVSLLKPEVVNHFKNIYHELEVNKNHYETSLSDEKQYLKTITELNFESFPIDSIKQIMKIVLNNSSSFN